MGESLKDYIAEWYIVIVDFEGAEMIIASSAEIPWKELIYIQMNKRSMPYKKDMQPRA